MSSDTATSSPIPKRRKIDKDAIDHIPEIQPAILYKYDDFPGMGSSIEIYEQVKSNLKYLSFNNNGTELLDENGQRQLRNRGYYKIEDDKHHCPTSSIKPGQRLKQYLPQEFGHAYLNRNQPNYKQRKFVTVQPQKIMQTQPVDFAAHFKQLGLAPTLITDLVEIVENQKKKKEFSRIFDEVVDEKLSLDDQPLSTMQTNSVPDLKV